MSQKKKELYTALLKSGTGAFESISDYEVIHRVVEGQTSQTISDDMGISVRTISRIREKYLKRAEAHNAEDGVVVVEDNNNDVPESVSDVTIDEGVDVPEEENTGDQLKNDPPVEAIIHLCNDKLDSVVESRLHSILKSPNRNVIVVVSDSIPHHTLNQVLTALTRKVEESNNVNVSLVDLTKSSALSAIAEYVGIPYHDVVRNKNTVIGTDSRAVYVADTVNRKHANQLKEIAIMKDQKTFIHLVVSRSTDAYVKYERCLYEDFLVIDKNQGNAVYFFDRESFVL